MRHVDALSGNTISVCLIQERNDGFITKIQAAQTEDPELKEIKKTVDEGNYEECVLRRDILYKVRGGNNLLIVPRSMQHEIIK